VALAQRRSSAGRETVDQIFFERLTSGRVKSAADFRRAAATTPQTFNSFYASREEIAFVTTGRLPVQPRGVNSDLPVDGRGRFEWRGYLRAARHPQSTNPANGLLVNWNNKPARDFPAGDTRWDEGGTQRVDWLLTELARRERHTPASVLGAANAAATADPCGLMWPAVIAVCARGRAERARPGGGRPHHRVERRRGRLGRRRRRRHDRRAGPGRHGGGVERAHGRSDVRAAGRGAVRRARNPAGPLPAAADEHVRRLAPVPGQGPAPAGRRSRPGGRSACATAAEAP